MEARQEEAEAMHTEDLVQEEAAEAAAGVEAS